MNHQIHPMEDPIVPRHDELRSDDSFKVPTFYFESLTDRVMKRVERDAVPEELKENNFRVPDGYFEQLSDRIMLKLQPAQSRTIKTGFRRAWVYSAAAAVTLVIVSWFAIHLYSNKQNPDYLANSSEEELLEYVSMNNYDFDQNSLAVVMNDEDVNNLDIMDDVDDDTSNMLMEIYK